MVNAKNAFGGYVGFMPFIASISEPIGGYDLSTVISIADDKYGYEAIVTQCIQYGYSL